MRVKITDNEAASTNCLGDWYALDLVLQRRQFILAVSEKSRLGVLINASPYATFPGRLPAAIADVLVSVGVKPESIKSEMNEMAEILLAKTQNRSVVGTMNDYRKQLEFMSSAGRWRLDNLRDLSQRISSTPSLVMEGTWPQEVALQLFGQPPENTLVRKLFQKPGLRLVKQ